MTQARSALVSIDDTSWYHCVNPCVAGHFYVAKIIFQGGWIAERMKQLAGVFAIDVAGFAVMSKHYHAILRIDKERAVGWPVDEVLER